MRWVRSVTVLRIGLILSLRALFKHERFDSLEKKSPQRTHAAGIFATLSIASYAIKTRASG